MGRSWGCSKHGLCICHRNHNTTRLSCPVSPSLFLLSITSNMDVSDLMALSSQVTTPRNVFDGRNNPIYSPSEGVFVI